jgi:RsiW-degrading membrane proteinase PrsW (M82 family)
LAIQPLGSREGVEAKGGRQTERKDQAMSAWTDRRRKAARNVLVVLGIVAWFAFGFRSEHRACGNPILIAFCLFGGCLLLLQVALEIMVVLFGETNRFAGMSVLDDMLGMGT